MKRIQSFMFYELFAECAEWLQSKNVDKTAWSG